MTDDTQNQIDQEKLQESASTDEIISETIDENTGDLAEEKTEDTIQEEALEVPEKQEVQVESPNLVIISKAENKKARWYVVHAYSGHEKKVAEAVRIGGDRVKW